MLTFGTSERDLAYSAQIQRRREVHRRYDAGEVTGTEERSWREAFAADVIRHSPLCRGAEYRRALRPGGIDFTAIPVLEKWALTEMCHHLEEIGATRELFRVQTSGSTGVPLQMYLDEGYFVAYFGQFAHLIEQLALSPSAGSVSMMTLSVFEHVPSYRIRQPDGSYGHRTNINKKLWHHPREILEYLEEKQPLILRAMPSTFNELINMIGEGNGRAPCSPAAVITFAETLTDGTRQRIAEAFGAPVLDEYGLTEVGGIVARECRARNGFHIHGVNFHVEIVDAEDRPVRDHESGQILVTNLYNRCVPLLRYRTGDWGVRSAEPCRCGSRAPRLLQLEGRALTRFTERAGTTYNPFDRYRRQLFSAPFAQFQMVQEADERITLHYYSPVACGEHPALAELRRAVREVHGTELQIVEEQRHYFDQPSKLQSFLRLSSGGCRSDVAPFGPPLAEAIHLE